MTKYLKELLPYFALFLLGAFAASAFSPFATISRQTGISSIASDDLHPAFSLAVGMTWEYEGWIRQQKGQEQNPPREDYFLKETVVQQDKATSGNARLVTIRREERRDHLPVTTSTAGYFVLENKYFRIENEESLDAVRKYLYGDLSDQDIIAEISLVPTYKFSSDTKGCFRIQSKSLSSNYEETFCTGIGPVAMHYTHHGTIDEYSLELVSLK